MNYTKEQRDELRLCAKPIEKIEDEYILALLDDLDEKDQEIALHHREVT